MSVEIVPLSTEVVREVVDVHVRAFPEFFLTFLGPGFLKEFYKSFLYDDQGIGFVAADNNKIVGVIVGPLKPDGYFKRLLLRKWYAFCFASIGAVLKKPSTIKRLFRAVFYRGQAPSGMDRALLSSIAVSPDAQGKGVGKALVMKWLEAVSARSGKGAYLTTDVGDSNTANSFYRGLGWEVESTYETAEGRKMNRYVYDFKESES
jgi:ribosomal protein S18 acetylase RimI-like enzyme